MIGSAMPMVASIASCSLLAVGLAVVAAVIVVWQSITVTLFSLPLALLHWQAPGPGQWLLFLLCGVFLGLRPGKVLGEIRLGPTRTARIYMYYVAGGAAGLLVGLVSLTAALSGCGSESADGPVTLRFVWWGNEDRAKVTRAAVDEFQKRNPDIKVETEYSGYDAYFQKLSTQVAGGAGPDLLQLDRATVGGQGRWTVAEDCRRLAGPPSPFPPPSLRPPPLSVDHEVNVMITACR